jgi:hypothetical protein
VLYFLSLRYLLFGLLVRQDRITLHRRLVDIQILINEGKFDEMLSITRLYNAVGTMAARPVLIHVILMSIVYEHYKQLTKIAK